MNTIYILLTFTLMLFSGVEAITSPPSTVEVKSPLVSINGIQKKLAQSTSCDAHDWDNNQQSACTCCILKKTFESKDTIPKEALHYCLGKAKKCTTETLYPLGYASASTDEEFIQNLIDKSQIFLPVELPPGAFLNDGKSLSATGVTLLLTKLFNNEPDLSRRLKLTPQELGRCYEAKALGEGGAKTLQLFAIKNRCEGGSIRYILKEMLKPNEEAANIAKIKNSPLNIMNLANPNRPKNLPGIALDIVNLVYADKHGKSHRMALLTLAPGKSFFDLTRDFVETFTGYAEGSISEDNYRAARKKVEKSFESLGESLGLMHKAFKPEGGAPLTKTKALHGDLHLHNVFVDPKKNYAITLIDTETMAYSLDKPHNITDDLNKVYLYATLHRFSKQRARKGLPANEWHAVMFKPFIQGYANAYGDLPLESVKKALLGIYSPKLLMDIMTLIRANPIKILEFQRKYLHPMIKSIAPARPSRDLPPPPRPIKALPPLSKQKPAITTRQQWKTNPPPSRTPPLAPRSRKGLQKLNPVGKEGPSPDRTQLTKETEPPKSFQEKMKYFEKQKSQR